MKKWILSSISLILMISVLVYNLKNSAYVHEMKFTGEYTVVYNDVSHSSNNVVLNQTLFYTFVKQAIVIVLLISVCLPLVTTFKSQNSYLNLQARAPPTNA